EHLRVVPADGGRLQRGPDGAGRDLVGAYLTLDQLLGKRTGEAIDGALGRGVVDQQRVADERVDRGGVDDRSAGLQVGQGGARKVEIAMDVGGEGRLPLLVGDVLEPFLHDLAPRVVDQHVEPAEGRDGAFDRTVAVTAVADVAGQQQAASTLFVHHYPGGFGIIQFVEVPYRHVRAFAGEVHHRRPADATVAAADQRDLAGQLTAAFVAVADELGRRLHLALQTGLTVLFLSSNLRVSHTRSSESGFNR